MNLIYLLSEHLPTVAAIVTQDPSIPPSTTEYFSSESPQSKETKEITQKLKDYNKKHPLLVLLYLIVNIVFILGLLYFMFFAIDLALHCPVLPKWLTIITLLILFFSTSKYSLLFLILYLILIITVARRYQCTDESKIITIDVGRLHHNITSSFESPQTTSPKTSSKTSPKTLKTSKKNVKKEKE
uniref:Uncharacterized protein n=1 Tax=viral metagenome TaxID=1070528 RepID=A0A6C0D101_9ZZZZ